MSIISNAAKGLLKLDARIQNALATFWKARSDSLRAQAMDTKGRAEAELTVQLATLQRQYKQDVERLMRQLSDRKDDNVDKAYARRDMDVLDAQDDLNVASSLDDTAMVCFIKQSRALAALDALDGAE